MSEADETTAERFFRAIKKGDLLAIRKLAGAGADVNATNRFGWSPLMYAACEGSTPIMRTLIAAGANVNAVNNFGVSPLAYAALEGHWRAVELLLNAGARVNVRPHGVSLLQFAEGGAGRFVTTKHFEILKKAGAK
jgi:ankyrin repeat protein